MKKIDKYNLPEGVIDNDEVKEELIEKLLPKLDKILEDNSDDERQKIKEYIINKIDDDTITDTTLEIVGESWQRELKKIINEAKLFVASTSKKSGKTYPKASTLNIIEALNKYWDDDLPLGHNRKTWFHKIADDNMLSFGRVHQIEKDNRPPTFVPKRK